MRGGYAADRARGHSRSQPHACAARPRRADRRGRAVHGGSTRRLEKMATRSRRRCTVLQPDCVRYFDKPSTNAFSVGPHFAHSTPVAEWPKSVSISKYFASTPAFASLSITSGAIDGGNSLSEREIT